MVADALLSGYGSLSVVMPCYNEEATLAEVVERVLASPFTGELIIVDDGSADRTLAIAREVRDPQRQGIRPGLVPAAETHREARPDVENDNGRILELALEDERRSCESRGDRQKDGEDEPRDWLLVDGDRQGDDGASGPVLGRQGGRSVRHEGRPFSGRGSRDGGCI